MIWFHFPLKQWMIPLILKGWTPAAQHQSQFLILSPKPSPSAMFPATLIGLVYVSFFLLTVIYWIFSWELDYLIPKRRQFSVNLFNAAIVSLLISSYGTHGGWDEINFVFDNHKSLHQCRRRITIGWFDREWIFLIIIFSQKFDCS